MPVGVKSHFFPSTSQSQSVTQRCTTPVHGVDMHVDVLLTLQQDAPRGKPETQSLSDVHFWS